MNAIVTSHTAVPLLGRLAIASLFIVAGLRKALTYAGTVGYFTKLGLPAPEVAVLLAIVVELGAAALLIAGWKTRWMAWLLVIFTAVATAYAHRFWEFEAAQYGNQLNHFLKNLAIIGGLFFVAAFGPGPMSVEAARTK